MVSYIMAAGILTLPRTAVEEAGTPDVWISVLLGGLVTTAAGVVMTKLSQHYPGQTFFNTGRHCRKVAQYCDQPAFH
ncbi:GerAB/ArcD/ProY family transporter [Bacillus licheniformis]|nr:GerAB/ArcD/ProY family transporter [Bacillus licheniformis]